VEVNNIILTLACFGRVYNHLSANDAVAVARKTVEIAGPEADEIDLLNAWDDVWAVSLKAGLISEENTRPIHPIQAKKNALKWETDERVRKTIMEFVPEDDGIKRPDHYDDLSLAARPPKPRDAKKRWVKNNNRVTS
jgi:hypothetical protein